MRRGLPHAIFISEAGLAACIRDFWLNPPAAREASLPAFAGTMPAGIRSGDGLDLAWSDPHATRIRVTKAGQQEPEKPVPTFS
jgi:hypothetical protein